METSGPMDVANSSAVDVLEAREIRTRFGLGRQRFYRFQNSDVVVLSFGEVVGGPTPVRIHSTCFTAHYMASVECDCREQLEMTMAHMGAAQAGVIVFLDQDGRGNGQVALMRSSVLSENRGISVGDAYEQLGYPRDARDFRAAGLVLRDLGLTEVLLWTNNPAKVAALVSAGLSVAINETSVSETDGPWLADYYRKKATEGHMFSRFEGDDLP